MRRLHYLVGLASIGLVQTLGLALGTPVADAQGGGQSVIMVVGEKSLEACRVRTEKVVDGRWEYTGPARPCSGGIVQAYLATEEEANASMSAASTGAVEVRTVPFTGDPAIDNAAVAGEMTEIHELFAPDSPPPDDEALVPGATFGFMAPAEPDDTPVAAAQPGDCRQGRIGQEKREEFFWKHRLLDKDFKAYAYYSRWSCERWMLMKVEVRQLDPWEYKYYFYDIEYDMAYYPGSSTYEHRTSSQICKALEYRQWTSFYPSWEFKAKYDLAIELVDTHPRAPGRRESCQLQEGTSITSFEQTLNGGIR